MVKNIVRSAIEEAGGPKTVGPKCGRTYQAALKWLNQGFLPRTEWTGQTDYAGIIERLCGGKYTKDQLLSVKPGRKRVKPEIRA
jgi:hypothetical protein